MIMTIKDAIVAVAIPMLLSTTGCHASEGGSMTRLIEGDPQQIGNHVSVPYIPSKLDFAGEPMPISRFDVRERMEEDMTVTLYMHSRTLKTLRSTRRYFPAIEAALKEAGIPEDLKYITMAESNLIPTARSGAGAAGMWQLMPATAKEAGLEVNNYVDERYHVEKATKVACKYLNSAYKKFGNWTTAAASYNVGMAGVSRRAASQNNESSYYNLFLPEETMRYIYRILSFKLLVDNPQQYNYHVEDEDYYEPFKYREVEVATKNISWSKVAQDNGTTYMELRLLNPWIREYTHPNSAGKRYIVKIPID